MAPFIVYFVNTFYMFSFFYFVFFFYISDLKQILAHGFRNGFENSLLFFSLFVVHFLTVAKFLMIVSVVFVVAWLI